jgi:hypothetical protein
MKYGVSHMERDPDDLLTITVFAAAAGAHANSADKYQRLGELKCVRASNGVRLFSRSEVPKLRALVEAGRAKRKAKS